MSTIVTAAPPTPNGDLHLGHLSGPYSGADAFTRACRLRGEAAELLIGSDIHQSYMPEKARELGEDVFDVAARFDTEIERLFGQIGFSNRQYIKPEQSKLHGSFVQEFFIRLHLAGKIEPRDLPSMYCETCDLHLVDAYLTGTCPHCGNDDCDGNLCEQCAWPNSCVDLIDPRCNFCRSTPRRSVLRRLVFPLSRYASELKRFHRSVFMSAQLETLCDELLTHGLPDIAVTQPMPWGVPVTISDFTHQRYFVWAEMVPGYFASLAESLRLRGQSPQTWREEWNKSDLVQFFGWDNGYFHALLFPALMTAYDDALRLPAALVTNEFYQLDNLKFSTSRQHAIWGSDFLRVVPADICRFVLAADRPEHASTSFSLEKFHAIANGELAGRWQGWLSGIFSHQRGNDLRDVELLPSHTRFIEGLSSLVEDCLQSYSAAHYSLGRVTRALIELVTRACDFSSTQARCRASGTCASERVRDSAAAVEAAAARLLAQLSTPVMPHFSRELWTALGEDGDPIRDGILMPPGPRSGSPVPTFFTPLHLGIRDVQPLAADVTAPVHP